MKPKITPQQVRAAFDEVLSGRTLSEVARELGVHVTTLAERCCRRYPQEYAQAQRSGRISPGARTQPADPKDPAVAAYLEGPLSLREVAREYGIPVSTLRYKVVKAQKMLYNSAPN